MCSVIENLSIKMVPKTTTNTWANWATKCTNSNSRDYISYVLSCPYSKVLPNSFILLPEYQVHILDEKRELENVEEVKLNDQKDQIFYIITEPNEVNILFPRKKSGDGNVKPGIVVKNKRMSKRRCKTCKEREGCIHLGIFLKKI